MSGSTSHDSDEEQIRSLILDWATAVHVGDLEGVLVDHGGGIVMCDVPPPEDGIEDYRARWPPFFEWQFAGASFEIVSLDVTAGADVAYAWALLRCGTDAELVEHPDRRLRLTVGLRKRNGTWTVTHEHHSFLDPT